MGYRYNGLGQLVGASGRTEGRTTVEVKTPKRDGEGNIIGDTNKDGVRDDGETWAYGFVDQKTVTVDGEQVCGGDGAGGGDEEPDGELGVQGRGGVGEEGPWGARVCALRDGGGV